MIASCATLPKNFDRPKSYASADTENSSLAKTFEKEKAAHPGPPCASRGASDLRGAPRPLPELRAGWRDRARPFHTHQRHRAYASHL